MGVVSTGRGSNLARWLIAGLALALTLLSACADTGARDAATRHGFSSAVVQGEPFLHQVFFRPGRGDTLHVYLEGDGRPWLSPGRISLDPTGKRLLMLDLAAMDEAPVLYVGRPCYFGVDDGNCSPQWWTFYRYADAVVNSTSAAIGHFSGRYAQLALFGYSGGGTLAMLMAPRRDDLDLLVTIAGNLDITAWAEYHDYSPLTGSLNPASQPPLRADLRQYHLLGADDDNVTREMIEPVVSRQPEAGFRVVPGFDHRCCWREYWPSFLREVSEQGVAR